MASLTVAETFVVTGTPAAPAVGRCATTIGEAPAAPAKTNSAANAALNPVRISDHIPDLVEHIGIPASRSCVRIGLTLVR
jgi:hypothetical protein